MASQLVRVQLRRVDSSTPWGFRLDGGVDVARSLRLQRVTPGGLAERHGLRSGDNVVRINQSDTGWMRHEDAKMEIIRSSNDIDLMIRRDCPASPTPTPTATATATATLMPSGAWRPKVVSCVQLSPGGRAGDGDGY
ncbi:unnamed protein product, partial [Protopolystoma xenopodis]